MSVKPAPEESGFYGHMDTTHDLLSKIYLILDALKDQNI